MNGIKRPSPAMIVATTALIIAIGGTAFALPGKFTVGRDDLKKSSVGARALGKMLVGHAYVLGSTDPIAGDGQFKEVTGIIQCPPKAPTAIDPSVSGLSNSAFESKRVAITNRFGAPRGYRITVLTDDGPGVGYTMEVNCLFAR